MQLLEWYLFQAIPFYPPPNPLLQTWPTANPTMLDPSMVSTVSFISFSSTKIKEQLTSRVVVRSIVSLTLLHSEKPKLHRVLAFLSAVGLTVYSRTSVAQTPLKL